MSYNPTFEINPDQLKLIENALRAEMTRMVKPHADYMNDDCPKWESAKQIRELLGHLHNQKLWYRSKDSVPQG